MEITNTEFSKALELFKYVNANTDTRIQEWYTGRPILTDKVYKYCKNNKCVAIWMDFNGINEIKLKRILKKINILPYEFFIYHYNDRIRIGWRTTNQIKI